MILEDALCNLKTALDETGYFHKLYVLAEKIQDGDKMMPKFYTRGGQVENLHNFDVNGSGYVRIRSQVGFSPLNGTQITSCNQDDYVVISYPLRGVFAVPKIKLYDSAFSSHTLALELIAAINAEDTAVNNASSIGFKTTSYLTDINQIWREEVSGVDYQMNLNLSYVAIDFTLSVEVQFSCLENCYGGSPASSVIPADPINDSCMITGLHITTEPYTLTPDTVTTVLIMDPSHIVTLPNPSQFQAGITYLFKDGTGAAGTDNLQIVPAAGKNFELFAPDDILIMADDGQTVAIFSDLLNTYYFDNS